MIIETIISSMDQEGRVNLAPIGVHISDNFYSAKVKEISLELFPGSQTYENLRLLGEGVVNLTKDVSIFVETALFSTPYPTLPAKTVAPPRLAQATTFFEFRITDFDAQCHPAKVNAQVSYWEMKESLMGFCRAQGVILEATIMATRLSLISSDTIKAFWPGWSKIVRRTGGEKERQALKRIAEFLHAQGIRLNDSG